MISKAMDWLESKVSSAKKLHEAVYKEEQTLAYTSNIPISHTIYKAAQNANYTQTIAVNSFPNSCFQQGIQTTTTTGVGLGNYVSVIPNQYLAGQQSYYQLPLPSGMMVATQIFDAGGNPITVAIDQAYYQILQEIMLNPYTVSQSPYIQPLPQAPTIEGEFSLDEMDEAELLIAELEHGAN
jgi:hypothetical protein